MNIKRAFTLIEILVSFAVGLIIFGVVAIASINFVKNRQIKIVSETLVSYLRAAEQRALASEGNNSHGVSTANQNLTLFRGTSYAARVSTYDAILSYPSYINIAGLSEVVFGKQTGAPSATGTFSVNNGIRTEVITVYSTGAISQ